MTEEIKDWDSRKKARETIATLEAQAKAGTLDFSDYYRRHLFYTDEEDGIAGIHDFSGVFFALDTPKPFARMFYYLNGEEGHEDMPITTKLARIMNEYYDDIADYEDDMYGLTEFSEAFDRETQGDYGEFSHEVGWFASYIRSSEETCEDWRERDLTEEYRNYVLGSFEDAFDEAYYSEPEHNDGPAFDRLRAITGDLAKPKIHEILKAEVLERVKQTAPRVVSLIDRMYR